MTARKKSATATPGKAEKKKILKERAKLLAAYEPAGESSGSYLDVTAFQLSRENYAFETQYLLEVYPMKHFTVIPNTPDFVLGLLNFHGDIISIIDIKKFFGLPEKGITNLNKVLVIESGDMCFGVLADYVYGRQLVDRQKLQTSVSTPGGLHEKYLMGVTDERLIVMDAGRLLSDSGMLVRN